MDVSQVNELLREVLSEKKVHLDPPPSYKRDNAVKMSAIRNELYRLKAGDTVQITTDPVFNLKMVRVGDMPVMTIEYKSNGKPMKRTGTFTDLETHFELAGVTVYD